MKFYQFSSFEKHLNQGPPYYGSLGYLVIASCPYERKKIAEKIFLTLKKKEGEVEFCSRSCNLQSLSSILEEVDTFSLTGMTRVFYLDGVDKLKPEGLDLLSSYLVRPVEKSPHFSSFFIFGASSAKPMGEFYSKGKRELVVCDLSEEKPWEKKERLKKHCIQFALEQGKRFQGDGVERLIERIGLDFSHLEQEVTKLICYVGEKKEIDGQAVEALSSRNPKESLWQMAEEILWDKKLPLSLKTDPTLLFPLISQLRIQLQQGCIVAALKVQGMGIGEVAHYLPSLKSHALEKVVVKGSAKPFKFFKQGLDALFEMELSAKNGTIDPCLLIEQFLASVHEISSL